MTQQIDIEKIKAALNAIEELEQIARSTQPADIKNFCVEYNMEKESGYPAGAD